MRITVIGKPIPKGRPRFGNGRTYTPKRTEAHEALVAAQAGLVWRGPPYAGETALSCVFYGADKTADGDNCLKLVADALGRDRRAGGFVIANDRDIKEWHAWVKPKDESGPRTEILLEAL